MTRNPEELQVRGLDKSISWFGRFPSFHDAELTSISLDRSGGSRVTVHPFGTTAEIDEKGSFV
jgi:hypothetical protein